MNNLWADDVEEELHPSIPIPGDQYDDLGRNMSAQLRRENRWGKWILVKYNKKFY